MNKSLETVLKENTNSYVQLCLPWPYNDSLPEVTLSSPMTSLQESSNNLEFYCLTIDLLVM